MAHFEELDTEDYHAVDNDCDIEICEEPNFVELAHNTITANKEYKPVIGNTLESIGKLILRSMFTEINKKDVVQSLMTLFENELQYTQPFTLMNDELHQVHKLYQEKYNHFKEHIENYKNHIFQTLRDCIKKCKNAMMEKQEQLSLLKASAQRILSKINKKDFVKKNIIKEEFEKVFLHIKRDYDSMIKFIKMNFEIENYNYEKEYLAQKDREIEMLSKNIIPQTFENVRSKYEAEIKNLEFHISKQIQTECEQYWLESMGIAK